ncbi:hypothetical protein ACYSNW_08040 [Enterococcus sp. LJL99]
MKCLFIFFLNVVSDKIHYSYRVIFSPYTQILFLGEARIENKKTRTAFPVLVHTIGMPKNHLFSDFVLEGQRELTGTQKKIVH